MVNFFGVDDDLRIPVTVSSNTGQQQNPVVIPCAINTALTSTTNEAKVAVPLVERVEQVQRAYYNWNDSFNRMHGEAYILWEPK